jgi:HrpA-like RNA helicase
MQQSCCGKTQSCSNVDFHVCQDSSVIERLQGNRVTREDLKHGAKVILEALRDSPGNVLVFLPGAGDIRRMIEVLKARTPFIRSVP